METQHVGAALVAGIPSATWSLWVTAAMGILWAWDIGHKEGCIQMCSEARACLGHQLASHTRAQRLLSVVLHQSSRGSPSRLH